MSAVKKIVPPEQLSLVVNNATISWGEGNNSLKFFGNESILFWVKPSLISMLQPLQEELGEDLYSRLVAFESSKGTYEDYHAMVSSMGKNFEEGFYNWGQAVSACGWGTFHIQSIDWNKKEALVRIEDPWELKLFHFKDPQNNIPFLNGKVSGIFSHAFGTNCRSEVKQLITAEVGKQSIVLKVKPSNKTLEEALSEINKNEAASEKSRLRSHNNALRRHERRLLDVVDTVGDFIWEVDRNLRVTFATDKAYEILQTDEKSLIGKTWEDLLSAEEFLRLQTLLTTLVGKKKFAEGDFSFELVEGESRWIHFRMKQLLDFNGNHLGYVGSGRDITVKRDLQLQLVEQQKSAEFAAKMATLGEMAGGVAHEINTPLTVISLLSEQLIEELENSPQHKGAATKILETTNKIAKIIQGLRSFARDATHDPNVLTSMSEIIDDTLSLCRSRIQNNGIQLRYKIATENSKFKCRPTQISQVLMNLFNNACDAVNGLKEKWISIEVSETSEYIQVKVSDSGVGIPLENRQKIMNPFFTTKPVGEGTGLGLSISRGICESHSGSLNLEPNAINTTFVMRIPKI
jgi:PAS domain S-box-containing protein